MLDPRTHQPTNALQLFDQNSQRNRAHHGSYYDIWQATDSGFWPSRTETESPDESGVCSPPLWATSPRRGSGRSNNQYRNLSPASRTQAIVNGQRELMDMVKNMPESNYELSLKDLVEHHRVQQRQPQQQQENNNAVGDERKLKGSGGASGRNKAGKVKRSGSIDRGSGGGGGFYLKMGLPFTLGSKNKSNKKSNNKNKDKSKNENGCSKVSPRPSAVSDGSVKEWWKKSPSGGSKESDSGVSSINSGSTKSSGSSSSNSTNSTSNSRHEKTGGRCWPCIPKPKRQARK